MDLGIEGRTALVTGAGRGIGRGVCTTLHREGANIIAVSRTEQTLIELEGELGSNPSNIYLPIDFAAESSVDGLVKYLHESGKFPDIVVNNLGGHVGPTDPLQTSVAWDQTQLLNIYTAMAINEAFIPEMQRRQWGRICHVSSLAAMENQGTPAYCATKAALNAYVRSLARYVAADNVILSTVMPGAVHTQGGYWERTAVDRPEHFSEFIESRMSIGRLGEVAEIAEAVTFLCSDLASFCVGTMMLVDGGQGRTFQNV